METVKSRQQANLKKKYRLLISPLSTSNLPHGRPREPRVKTLPHPLMATWGLQAGRPLLMQRLSRFLCDNTLCVIRT